MLPTLHGEGLVLRPPTGADLAALAAIVSGLGVREWWGELDGPARVRDDLGNDGAAFAIVVGGVAVGWLGFSEETEPEYLHAGLDIFLSPAHQGRGRGPAALRTAIRWLAASRGHHRFTIDPALANERAIRAYSAVGFRPVGILRHYERGLDGTWHDGLLMDLLIDELEDHGTAAPQRANPDPQ